MRVIGCDLDGVLAHTGEEIDRRLMDKFGGTRAELDEQGVQINDYLYSLECFGDPELWWGAEPDRERIEYLQRWAQDRAWAPAIITSRPMKFMAITEIWLAKHGVPYGTLLMDAHKFKPTLCYHLGAKMLIEDDYWAAYHSAAMGALDENAVPLTSYVMKTHYNAEYEDLEAFRVRFVDSFQEIEEYEDAISDM